MSKNYDIVGISLRRDFLRRIDKDRGLIPRSTFLQNLLEQAYKVMEAEKN